MSHIETVVFGGGCFWCTEAIFKMLRGVELVEPGYAGGNTDHPTYYSVAGKTTGHAEVVQIEYDADELSFENLLTVFFATHDPTSVDRQGNDVGPEYRSIILYTTDQQKSESEKFIATLNNSSEFGEPIVTEIKKLEKFFPAEDEHKNFYSRNKTSGYCQFVINPKLDKVRKRFSELIEE